MNMNMDMGFDFEMKNEKMTRKLNIFKRAFNKKMGVYNIAVFFLVLSALCYALMSVLTTFVIASGVPITIAELASLLVMIVSAFVCQKYHPRAGEK